MCTENAALTVAPHRLHGAPVLRHGVADSDASPIPKRPSSWLALAGFWSRRPRRGHPRAALPCAAFDVNHHHRPGASRLWYGVVHCGGTWSVALDTQTAGSAGVVVASLPFYGTLANANVGRGHSTLCRADRSPWKRLHIAYPGSLSASSHPTPYHRSTTKCPRHRSTARRPRRQWRPQCPPCPPPFCRCPGHPPPPPP